jgi:3-hydroxyacyl-[acyl-carrier-protein] dehydratase
MIEGFFDIIDERQEGNRLIVNIRLNSDHVIYKAHFPGQPVTPGVCIIAMAQDILEHHYGHSLRMLQAKNVKFLKILSPVDTPSVVYTMTIEKKEDGHLKVISEISHEDSLFAKLSIECQFE